MSFAEALVDAIRDALRADTAVAALVGRQVFDVVPGLANTPHVAIKPPWIFVGPLGAPRFEDDCRRGWQPRLRLFVNTDSFDRGAAWRIVDAIDGVLDRKTLPLAGGFTMTSDLRAVDCGDLIDPAKPRAAFADFECVILRDATFDETEEDL